MLENYLSYFFSFNIGLTTVLVIPLIIKDNDRSNIFLDSSFKESVLLFIYLMLDNILLDIYPLLSAID